MSVLRVLCILKYRLAIYRISRLERNIGIGKQIEFNYSPHPHVKIQIMTGNFSGLVPGYQATPQNFIEAMLGITFEDKINRVYKKVKRQCDELNYSESRIKYYVEVNND